MLVCVAISIIDSSSHINYIPDFYGLYKEDGGNTFSLHFLFKDFLVVIELICGSGDSSKPMIFLFLCSVDSED